MQYKYNGIHTSYSHKDTTALDTVSHTPTAPLPLPIILQWTDHFRFSVQVFETILSLDS